MTFAKLLGIYELRTDDLKITQVKSFFRDLLNLSIT